MHLMHIHSAYIATSYSSASHNGETGTVLAASVRVSVCLSVCPSKK